MARPEATPPSRTRSIWRLLALFGAAALILAACGGGDGTVVSDDGTTVEVDEEGGTVKVETEDGTVTLEGGEGGEIPEGFPAGFPVPDGATVTGSLSGENNGAAYFNVYWKIPGEVAALLDFYEQGLADTGYTVTGSFEGSSGGSTSATVGFEGNGYSGSLVLGGTADGVEAAVSLVEGEGS